MNFFTHLKAKFMSLSISHDFKNSQINLKKNQIWQKIEKSLPKSSKYF